MTHRLLTTCLVLVGSSCGRTDPVGGSMPADAATDRADHPPTLCQQIKQQDRSAASGVYAISPVSTPQMVFCEMTFDGGGWTAFYVGDNGRTAGSAYFETAADDCPDPANRCLRHIPSTLDESHDFAVKCGAAAVKFKVGVTSTVLDYFKNGLQHGWQPITNAMTIDLAKVGEANLVANVWTGAPGNNGWIVAGPDAPSSTQAATETTFANGYTLNTLWNYCNGAADNASQVMLLYR
jgi:hypothetical protein